MHNCSCRCNRLSYDILRSAGVSTRVFRIGVHDIQGHETKAISLDESRASFHRLIIMEPFDFHRYIRHRDQSALEVCSLTFFDLNVVQGGGENWSLSGCFLDIFSALVSRSIFEVMNLFQANLVLSVCQNLRG